MIQIKNLSQSLNDQERVVYETPIFDRTMDGFSHVFTLKISATRQENLLTWNFNFFAGDTFAKNFSSDTVGSEMSALSGFDEPVISIGFKFDTETPRHPLIELLQTNLSFDKTLSVQDRAQLGAQLDKSTIDLLCMVVSTVDIFEWVNTIDVNTALVPLGMQKWIDTLDFLPYISILRFDAYQLKKNCSKFGMQEFFPSFTNLKTAIKVTLRASDCADPVLAENFTENIMKLLTENYTKSQIREAVTAQCQLLPRAAPEAKHRKHAPAQKEFVPAKISIADRLQEIISLNSYLHYTELYSGPVYQRNQPNGQVDKLFKVIIFVKSLAPKLHVASFVLLRGEQYAELYGEQLEKCVKNYFYKSYDKYPDALVQIDVRVPLESSEPLKIDMFRKLFSDKSGDHMLPRNERAAYKECLEMDSGSNEQAMLKDIAGRFLCFVVENVDLFHNRDITLTPDESATQVLRNYYRKFGFRPVQFGALQMIARSSDIVSNCSNLFVGEKQAKRQRI